MIDEWDAGDDERRRIVAELGDALSRTRALQRPNSRQLLVERLRERLQDLTLRDQPDPWHQSMEIIQCCTSGPPGTLWTMVKEVELIERASDHVVRLHQLQDEWVACDVLSGEDWQLRTTLEPIEVSHLTRLYQQVTDHRNAAPPAWCTHAWHVFVHLAGQNARPGLPPPHLSFLTRLEALVEPDTWAAVRRHLHRQASQQELTAEVLRERWLVDAGVDQPASSAVYLVIRLEPDFTPGEDVEENEHYRFIPIRQWHSADAWEQQVGDARMVRRSDLERVVAHTIEQMEIEWRNLLDTVVIEFVLPAELLNEGVEWWRTDADSARPTAVLATEYPVVVRSLERLRALRWHRVWRRRWHHLQNGSAHGVYWSEPLGPHHITRLEVGLRSDERWVGMVLSEPPTAAAPTGREELTAALRAGLPLIIWHRDGRGEAVREVVERITASGRITQLPFQMKLLRLEALDLDPERHANHVGWHLTLLWDDPDRLPDAAADIDYHGSAVHEREQA